MDPDNDPKDTWLATVKERLHEDRQNFRSDIEGDHDEIEEWEYRDGRVFISVGSEEDEADPLKGHGWMCRLSTRAPSAQQVSYRCGRRRSLLSLGDEQSPPRCRCTKS